MDQPAILGVSGSPIRDGTTERTLQRILAASQLDAELVRLWEVDVGPCKACLACARTNICTGLADDWLPLAAKLVRARAVVLGGWAPFNIIDARTKALIERAFSLRHSIMLLAGKAGAVVVTGTVDPLPVATSILAYFATEGLRAIGTVTPAGIDPCWSCGFGDVCTQGSPLPLARGEYELFAYPYADRLPSPAQFAISPDIIPPPVEEQAEVLLQADQLGRQVGEAVRAAEADRVARLERLVPGSSSLAGLSRLAALLPSTEDAAAQGELERMVERASRRAARGEAREAVATLLALARFVLSSESGSVEASDLVVSETRRAIAELYGDAALPRTADPR